MEQDQVELERVPSQTGQSTELEDHFRPTNESVRPIPPADGGKEAWLFLAACFIMEAVIWGFPFTFGLFQEYFSTHEPFASQGNTAIIGTCAMVRTDFSTSGSPIDLMDRGSSTSAAQ